MVNAGQDKGSDGAVTSILGDELANTSYISNVKIGGLTDITNYDLTYLKKHQN